MTAAPLSGTDYSPLLRTDFTDEVAWQALLDEIDTDWLTVMHDPAHEGLSVPDLLALVLEGSAYPALVVADGETFSSKERTLLLVDVQEQPGRTFRAAVPDAFDSVLGNLAIRNQTFDDCLDSGSLGDDGVYRLSSHHRQALVELQGPRGKQEFMEGTGQSPGPGTQRV
ncbi:DUF6924 domain-containing protein [Streptomyces sediminimaris]|uniref:DUF6924 domain-containing protein n=1 Tax=Streptomyces sediminimaris TaxID=3383721 RepID=UPI00399A6EBB